FLEADGGTLFLDEIGELSLEIQVKLLRALQEGEIVPVGASTPKPIDVRIIAATNRNLVSECAKGSFREDLYYRLAVAVLHLPPLREREGDVGLLIDSLMNTVNQESETEPGYKHKNISVSARNLMVQYSWPGNVRELLNTLRRAALWTDNLTISKEDIQGSIIHGPEEITADIMQKPLGNGFSIENTRDEMVAAYIKRAMKEAHDNKTKAAELLGIKNYQTLNNWMKKVNLN
ncbi:sigma 54-interacting transcriptional regulator, partial [Fibrobacterota bacterium]